MTLRAYLPMLLTPVVAVVAVAAIEAPAEVVPFSQSLDWTLVALVDAAGLVGALPRLDPGLRPALQQLMGGMVGGLVGGLGASETQWFINTPRAVLVIALIGGYMGTRLLDLAVERAMRNVDSGGKPK